MRACDPPRCHCIAGHQRKYQTGQADHPIGGGVYFRASLNLSQARAPDKDGVRIIEDLRPIGGGMWGPNRASRAIDLSTDWRAEEGGCRLSLRTPTGGRRQVGADWGGFR